MREVLRRPAPPEPTIEQPGRSRPPLPLQQLQRTAGNRAVTALVQRAAESALPPLTEGFNTDEETWIDEVWHSPGIELMFQAYGEIPTPVLERVKDLFNDDGSVSPTTEGVTHNEPEPGGPDIEISDAAYSETEEIEPPGSGRRSGTPEEEFKSTLIHELFHYLENNTKAVDPTSIITPETLKAILVEPRIGGFPEFAFGWFSRGGGAGYLGDAEISIMSSGHPSTWVEPDSPEAAAKEAHRYESSPDARGLEEDLATTIALFLTGPAFQGHLAETYPQRFRLVNGYFRSLQKSMAAGGT